MCKVMVCKECVFGGAIRAPLCKFFWFLPQIGVFCASVSRKPVCDTAHKPVCVQGMC